MRNPSTQSEHRLQLGIWRSVSRNGLIVVLVLALVAIGSNVVGSNDFE